MENIIYFNLYQLSLFSHIKQLQGGQHGGWRQQFRFLNLNRTTQQLSEDAQHTLYVPYKC